MVRKKKLPWGVLTVLLVLLLVGAYYMGGLFGMDGVNLLNWQNYLGYIIAHPLKSYWNEGTIGWMGIGTLKFSLSHFKLSSLYYRFYDCIITGNILTHSRQNCNTLSRPALGQRPQGKRRIYSALLRPRSAMIFSAMLLGIST